MSDFASALRRVVTAEAADMSSIVIVDGPPSATSGTIDTGGLFEIWHDLSSGPQDTFATGDLGAIRSILSPDPGHVRVRWFIIHPLPEGVPPEQLNAATRERFAAFGAEDHLTNQALHPAMHKTDTLDVICLLKGDVSLVLDSGETRMSPGQVVIQRGTSHAWRAHGGPALLLAVLIDRPRKA